MNETKNTVTVVPCSGIGKALGSVTREAAYELCDTLQPDRTRLVALSKLVLGDVEARDLVRSQPTVTIDGCKLMCAAKLVKLSDGTPVREIAAFDVFRNHKGPKPEGIAELNDAGKQLARTIATEISDDLDTIVTQHEGGLHA
jgi:DGC domain